MSFKIFTDTSANLPTKWLNENNVSVIAFSYYIEGKEYSCLDTDSFDDKEFYSMMKKGVEITTSQINPQKYIDNFEPYIKDGNDILYVGMSSGISGSYKSSQIAITELSDKYSDRKICSIDTLGASLGEGLVVMKAVECLNQGLSLDETIENLNNYVKCLYQVFTVDDLMFLKRSGRISNLTAVVGTVLNIKPLLKGNENGQIVSFAKERGRKNALNAMAKKYDTLGVDYENQTVCIAHAGCEEDAAYLEDLINKSNPPKEILTVAYEPVTGSHVGPGTLALFFTGASDVRIK